MMNMLFSRFLGLVAFVGFLLTTGFASATTWYVDNFKGNNTYDGRSPEFLGGSPGTGPVSTIRLAIDRSGPCDTIVIVPGSGPYYEEIAIGASRHWGTALEPFTILGNGAVVSGDAPVPPAAWEWVADDVFRFFPPRLSGSLLLLDGEIVPCGEAEGSNEIRALKVGQWSQFGGWIHMRSDSKQKLSSLPLRVTSLRSGLSLVGARFVRVEDLSFEGFSIDGVAVIDSFNFELSGVQCRHCARAGMSIAGASTGVLSSCSSSANGRFNLLVDTPARIVQSRMSVDDDGVLRSDLQNVPWTLLESAFPLPRNGFRASAGMGAPYIPRDANCFEGDR